MRRAGFTLLEMLIAMSISGIILVAAYGAFSAVTRASRTLDAREVEMRNLNVACAALQEDLRAAVRPPAGETGKNIWKSDTCGFQLTCGENRLATVQYRLRQHRLERDYRPEKEEKEARAGSRGRKSKKAVAESVYGLSFAYYADGNWQDQLRAKQWPAAVRVSFRFGKDRKLATTYRQVIRLEVR